MREIWKMRATFTPAREDDLKPAARERIGQRTVWRYASTSDPDERYPLQRRYIPVDWDMGWVPEEDLSDVEVLQAIGSCCE